jgi:hypothetical protein
VDKLGFEDGPAAVEAKDGPVADSEAEDGPAVEAEDGPATEAKDGPAVEAKDGPATEAKDGPAVMVVAEDGPAVAEDRLAAQEEP